MLALAHSAPWTQEAWKLYRTDGIWGFHAASMARNQAVALQDRETMRVWDL